MNKTSLIFACFFLWVFNPVWAQNANKDFKAIQYSTVVSDYEAYLSKYSKGKNVKIATQRLHCLKMKYAYDDAVKQKDISVYENYIETYKNFSEDCSKCDLQFVNGVKNNVSIIEGKLKIALEERDWKNTQLCNELSCYQKFVADYPRSFRLKTANDSIATKTERADWQMAKSAGTLDAFNAYKTNYPYGKYTSMANTEIWGIEAWQKARYENKHISYSKFLAENPKSMYADSAKIIMQQLEQMDWDKAKKTNTYTSYSAFEKKYPGGFYFNDAEKNIIDMEIADVKKKSPYASWLPMDELVYGDRDPVNSTLFMKNDTEYKVKVIFSGPQPKRVEIAPGDTLEFDLMNGAYTVSASIPNSSIDPYWGQDTYKGYFYSSTWYIKRDFFPTFR